MVQEATWTQIEVEIENRVNRAHDRCGHHKSPMM